MQRKRLPGFGLATSLLVMALVMVAAVAVGCASDEGISEEAMRGIVSDAVAESMPEEQMSAEDIQSMVESSMMEMMSGLGEAQMEMLSGLGEAQISAD